MGVFRGKSWRGHTERLAGAVDEHGGNVVHLHERHDEVSIVGLRVEIADVHRFRWLPIVAFPRRWKVPYLLSNLTCRHFHEQKCRRANLVARCRRDNGGKARKEKFEVLSVLRWSGYGYVRYNAEGGGNPHRDIWTGSHVRVQMWRRFCFRLKASCLLASDAEHEICNPTDVITLGLIKWVHIIIQFVLCFDLVNPS